MPVVAVLETRQESEMKPDEKVGDSVAAFTIMTKAMKVILSVPKAEVERRAVEWSKRKKRRDS